jgi:hypothetical protein
MREFQSLRSRLVLSEIANLTAARSATGMMDYFRIADAPKAYPVPQLKFRRPEKLTS